MPYKETLIELSKIEDISIDELLIEEIDIDKETMWLPVEDLPKSELNKAGYFQKFEGELEKTSYV